MSVTHHFDLNSGQSAVSHVNVSCHAYPSVFSCVTLDPNIKETTQTTNQIKCECMGFNPPTQCDLTNSNTLKQVAVGYYKESWGKQDLLWV